MPKANAICLDFKFRIIVMNRHTRLTSLLLTNRYLIVLIKLFKLFKTLGVLRHKSSLLEDSCFILKIMFLAEFRDLCQQIWL